MKDYITLTYWRLGHPLPVESTSDFYYVNFTRRLYHTIRNTDVGRQSTEDWVAETAMTLAYYLEDVVSGLGFWRTFVTKHKALYGKYLPFFEVDEKRITIWMKSTSRMSVSCCGCLCRTISAKLWSIRRIPI